MCVLKKKQSRDFGFLNSILDLLKFITCLFELLCIRIGNGFVDPFFLFHVVNHALGF